MRSAAALAVLVAPAAWAQAVVPTLTLPDARSDVFAKDECDDAVEFPFTWTFNAATTAPYGLTTGSNYALYVTSQKESDTCPQSPPSSNVLVNRSDADLRASNSVVLHANDIAGGTCDAGRDETRHVCFLFHEKTAFSTTVDHANSKDIRYDSKAPDPPTIMSVAEGDLRLTPTWSSPEQDPKGFTIYWRPAPPGSVRACPVATPDAGVDADGGPIVPDAGYDVEYQSMSALGTDSKKDVLRDLANGTLYEIRVEVTDEAGNRSDLSAACVAGPRAIDDFWAVYRNQGGVETGGCGCAALPAGSLGLSLAALGLARRRRRS